MADDVRALVKRPYPKHKRRKGKSNHEGNYKAPGEIGTSHYIGRRFELHERICEVIGGISTVAIAMTWFFNHRVGFVWAAVTTISAGLYAFCFWFTDHENKRVPEDAPPPSTASSTPSPTDVATKHATPPNELDKSLSGALSGLKTTTSPPVPSPTLVPSPAAIITPIPIAPAPPTPIPEVTSDTPYEDAITPEEVGRKLKEANKLGTIVHARKALAGVRIDGKLLFWSAEYTDDNQVSAGFISRKVAADAAETDLLVSFLLPMNGNERLPLTDRYVAFRTEGVITEVNAADVVFLKDVRLTRINPSTESPPMKEKQPHITTGDITSHNQGPGSFTGVNTGTVNLGPNPRTISLEDRKKFKTLVANSPKGRVQLAHTTDAEAYVFAKQLADLFNEAGYKSEITSSFTSVSSPPMFGLFVDVRDGTKPPPFAGPLRSALLQINIDNKGKVDEGLPDDCITVSVFPKQP